MNRFRKKQDENVPGISGSARVLRKKRNLVSMQFNMLNWLLETVSLVLVMVEFNVFLAILYLLVTSCGTPVVFQLLLPNSKVPKPKVNSELLNEE